MIEGKQGVFGGSPLPGHHADAGSLAEIFVGLSYQWLRLNA